MYCKSFVIHVARLGESECIAWRETGVVGMALVDRIERERSRR